MNEEDNLQIISRNFLLNEKNILVDNFIKLYEFNCNLPNANNINTFYNDLQRMLDEFLVLQQNQDLADEFYPGAIVERVEVLADLAFNNQITIGNYKNIFEEAFNIYLQRDATEENNINNNNIFRRRKYGSIVRLSKIFFRLYERYKFLDNDN
tara:strand:+ start:143 stop:601 length:459 start_codon:yes stop_codon:yes gene_type:complete